MTDGSNEQRDRLLELLADERIGRLDPEQRAELESLIAAASDDGVDADAMADAIDETIGRLLVAFDALDDAPGMPAEFRAGLERRGRAVVAPDAGGPIAMHGGGGSARSPLGWFAAAACLLVAVGIGAFAVWRIGEQRAQLELARAQAAERIEQNQQMLADARAELSAMTEQYGELEQRNLDLATRLADASSRLDQAELKIARLEAPEDPAVLAERRRQLLDVGGTFRVEWRPFDVAGLPDTEQPGVQGDVVWNDNLQQGYMRFVGLDVNNPEEEVYQVWVIDERGMEQKVSGGVFNATEDGEIIVPIEPGIDVGSVQVFAVTVEDSGGTWVPDLKRRVVIAPREQEDG